MFTQKIESESTMGNETWIIETGDAVIQKMGRSDTRSLAPLETLIYCVWVADYGMRNAGDLDSAKDVYSRFHSKARQIAEELSLPLTYEAFALKKSELEQQYFDRFDPMVDEIKHAYASSPRIDA
jgi:hypothetical protein